jgi:hypothetical protein
MAFAVLAEINARHSTHMSVLPEFRQGMHLFYLSAFLSTFPTAVSGISSTNSTIFGTL